MAVSTFIYGLPQVLALVLRPDKGHKARPAWNLYHHWVGRGAVALAIAEIFIGLRYSGQLPAYSVGAGVVIGALFLFGAGKEAFDKCLRRPATVPEEGTKGLTLAERGEARGELQLSSLPKTRATPAEMAGSLQRAGSRKLSVDIGTTEARNRGFRPLDGEEGL